MSCEDLALFKKTPNAGHKVAFSFERVIDEGDTAPTVFGDRTRSIVEVITTGGGQSA
jgi:hypothetical protein